MKTRHCPLCPAVTKQYSQFGYCPVHRIFTSGGGTGKLVEINGKIYRMSTEQEDEVMVMQDMTRQYL